VNHEVKKPASQFAFDSARIEVKPNQKLRTTAVIKSLKLQISYHLSSCSIERQILGRVGSGGLR
jgi:hypothetical protein